MIEARRQLARITGKVSRRLRLQRALEGATTAGIVFALAASVLLFAVKTRLLAAGQLTAGLLTAAMLPLLAALIQAARPVTALAAAQRIDRTHGLHDRVTTAQEFAWAAERSDWMRAQIADALTHVEAVSPARAAPLRRPRDLHVLGLLAILFVLIAVLRFPDGRPPTPPTPPTLAGVAIDPAQLDAQRELAADLAQRAEELSNPEVQRLAADLGRLLKQLEEKKLTRKELFAKLAELENKYMDGLEGDFDDLLKQFKKMGGELKKEKLTAELGRALDQGELAQAKRAAQQLAERPKPLKGAERQRAARALRRAARHELAPPKQVKARIANVERDIRRLKRKLAQQQQDRATRRRLRRKERQLKRLNRQQQRHAAQSRQLKRLNQQLDQAADLLSKLSADERETLRKLAEQLGKFADKIDSMRAMKKAQLSLRDLKEMLRRLGKGGKVRLARMRDFDRRAGGKKGDKKGDKKGGKGGQGGKQMFVLGPGGQMIPVPGAGQGQQGPGRQGDQPADGIGDGSDPNVMQDPTRIAARRKSVLVKGQESEGPTRSEVILGAADDGFSTTAYRRVYREYRAIVEEVLKQEEVPLGYKHYVKQYFWLIKPR